MLSHNKVAVKEFVAGIKSTRGGPLYRILVVQWSFKPSGLGSIPSTGTRTWVNKLILKNDKNKNKNKMKEVIYDTLIKNMNKITLTGIQQEFLIGTLLGDGYIFGSPTGKTYWYMDDGNWGLTNKAMRISTESYSLRDLEILKDMLQFKYDVEVSFNKAGFSKITGEPQFRLYIKSNSRENFELEQEQGTHNY
eukprot:gene12-20_t